MYLFIFFFHTLHYTFYFTSIRFDVCEFRWCSWFYAFGIIISINMNIGNWTTTRKLIFHIDSLLFISCGGNSTDEKVVVLPPWIEIKFKRRLTSMWDMDSCHEFKINIKTEIDPRRQSYRIYKFFLWSYKCLMDFKWEIPIRSAPSQNKKESKMWIYSTLDKKSKLTYLFFFVLFVKLFIFLSSLLFFFQNVDDLSAIFIFSLSVIFWSLKLT